MMSPVKDKERITFRPAGRFGEGKCAVFFVGSPSSWRSIAGTSASDLSACLLRTEREVLRGFRESDRRSVWIADRPSLLTSLATECVRSAGDRRLLVVSSI